MRRWLIFGLPLLLFCLLPVASSVAAPQLAVAALSRSTIIATANQAVYGQWTSPVSVTIGQLASPIRWGTFVAGRLYTGEAYTQNNPQENWATFSYNMRNRIGTPGVDQGSDCSGFTSIAWQIPRQTTWTFIPNGYAYPLGSHDELAPGDALLVELQHVAIFSGRLDSGLFAILEETDPQAQRSEWSWAYANTFTPVRRPSVTDSYATPVTPPRMAPAADFVTTSPTITFQWKPSTTTGVDGYRVRVATSAAALATGPWVLNTSVSSATTSIARTLSTRGELYWTVQACKGCTTGSPVYSTGTTPWKMTIRPTTGSWTATYYNGTAFNTVCATETFTGSHLFKDWLGSSPGACVVDYWSARFTQSVSFPGGRYTFSLGSDDWGRIKLDGTTVVNNWQGAGGRDTVWDVSAGVHTVTVEYAEVTGQASIAAWWSGPGFDMPREVKDPGQWYAEYYATRDLALDPVIRVNEGSDFIRHEWGAGSPGWGLPADRFSARFERTAYFPCGLYQFRLTQNNGARAYLDGALIPGLNNWIDADTRYTSLVRVPDGNHTLRVEYYENTGDATIAFSWSNYLACPGSPAPADGQTQVPTNAVLRWVGDPETIYPVRYTVYLNRSTTGAITPTTVVCSGISATSCDPPGDLLANSHYYWKVKADDGTGDVVDSPVWDFWTTSTTGTCSAGQFLAQYFNGTSLAGSAASTACESVPLSKDWGTGGPPGVGVDNFSARYSGQFSFLAGQYTFITSTDDGVRLWVDGVLLIDKWLPQSATTYRVTRTMTAGPHSVKMEYFEATGTAVAKLSWALQGGRAEVIVDDTSSGFTKGGSYWRESTVGYGGHSWWTYVNGSAVDSWGEWRANLGGGSYEVFVYVPSSNSSTTHAPYTVYYQGGQVTKYVNQSPYYDQWVSLGTYSFATGTSLQVRLTDATGEAVNSKRIAFDAVKFTAVSSSGTCYALGTSVSPSGSGSIEASPSVNCADGSSRYTAGTAVTLTATANGGYKFGSWSGDASGMTNPATVMMSADRSVTASFGAIADPCADLSSGQYCARYFNNQTLTGSPTYTTKESSPINHDWGNLGPGNGVPNDHFSARWEGTFDFATAGTYTFTATSDDGIRAYVDGGTALIDKWINQSATTYTGTKALTAGPHTVRVEYYENSGGAVAKLSWALQGSRPEVIVDDKSSGFTKGGSYWVDVAAGYLSHFFATTTDGSVVDCWSEWRTSLAGGSYEVFVYVPAANSYTTASNSTVKAPYTVYYQGGQKTVVVSQSASLGKWVSLGTYTFAAGTSGSLRVRLTDATGEAVNSKRIAFDAVKFTPR